MALVGANELKKKMLIELEGHPFTPGDRTVPMFWAGAVTPERSVRG